MRDKFKSPTASSFPQCHIQQVQKPRWFHRLRRSAGRLPPLVRCRTRSVGTGCGLAGGQILGAVQVFFLKLILCISHTIIYLSIPYRYIYIYRYQLLCVHYIYDYKSSCCNDTSPNIYIMNMQNMLIMIYIYSYDNDCNRNNDI